MAEYHVGCGFAGIYAGILKKNGEEWLHKSNVTEDAINAVRDYLFLQKRADDNMFGYEWTLKDGRKLKLTIVVEDAAEE